MTTSREKQEIADRQELQRLINNATFNQQQREHMQALLAAYDELQKVLREQTISPKYNDPKVAQVLAKGMPEKQTTLPTNHLIQIGGTLILSSGMELMKDIAKNKNFNSKDMEEVKTLTSVFTNTAAAVKDPTPTNIASLARTVHPMTQMMNKSQRRRELCGNILRGIGVVLAVGALVLAVTTVVAGVAMATGGAGVAAAIPVGLLLASKFSFAALMGSFGFLQLGDSIPKTERGKKADALTDITIETVTQVAKESTALAHASQKGFSSKIEPYNDPSSGQGPGRRLL